jgi:subtilisin family serine protease
MGRIALLLASVATATLLACAGTVAQGSATPRQADAEGVVPGRYIVVLKDAVSDPGQAAKGMTRHYGLQRGFVYGHALKGFSATIPNRRIEKVRADDRVDYVERDTLMRAVAQKVPWGIDKTDADSSSTLAGNGSGYVSNVNAYIIDTGIDNKHADLNVIGHVNFAGGPKTDCNGHGTHVAGTLAAKDNAQDVVGVAPGAPLTGVKVLDCNRLGSRSSVIEGIDWVTANAKKPAIANISISGPASRSVDDAVRKSAKSGIFYSVAAGNYGKNACNYSPARAGAGTNNGIVTTAATNKLNKEPSWSNYGSCVDLWAPGASILSTSRGGGTTTMSGTSMASPHVGGGGALYLASHTSAGVTSVEGVIKDAARTPGTKSKTGRLIRLENVGGF